MRFHHLSAFALLFAAGPAPGDTVLLENVNGCILDADRELARFSALQFTDGVVDRVFGADDILLPDRDLFAIPASEIRQIRALATRVDGERVFSRAARAADANREVWP